MFCLGLSRTGTTALAHHLESLGLRTLHYSKSAYVTINDVSTTDNEIRSPRRGRYWNWVLSREIKHANSITFDEILKSYDAFADLPFPSLYKEIAERHEHARFILTLRDEDKWLKSMQWLLSDGHAIWKHGVLDDAIMQSTYGTHVFEPEKLLAAYREHNSTVQQHFAGTGRLLTLNLDMGDYINASVGEFIGVNGANAATIKKVNASRTACWHLKLRHRLINSCPPVHFSALACKALLRRL